MLFSPLLANWLDSLHVEISDKFVCALTPVWILGIGAAVGLIFCAVIWGLMFGLSRIPVLGNLAANKQNARVVAAVLAVLLFVGTLAWWFQAGGQKAGLSIFDGILLLGGLGVGSWVVAMGVVTLLSRRAADEAWESVTEGVLTPFAVVVSVVALIGIFGTLFVRKPSEMFESLARWPALVSNGTVTQVLDVDPPAVDLNSSFEQAIKTNFRRDEVRQLQFTATQHLKVSSAPFDKPAANSFTLDLTPGETVTWRREGTATTPFAKPVVTELHVKNLGTGAAKLTMTRISTVANPEMTAAPVAALCVIGVFLVYLLQRTAMPKMTAVTLATAKTDFAQTVYLLVMAVGVFLLLLFIIMPMNTFGHDIKGMKTAGFALIPFLGLFVAIWSASTSLSEEIDGKTALTVLSKPVSRLDFILGKFTGIAWSTLFMVTVLGIVLLVGVAYKPVYDEREGADYTLTWQLCYFEMAQTVPGLVLVYLQVVVMTAISVAISTRLPFIPNLLICFTIWALGHLTPQLVQSQVVAEQLPPIVFFSQLIATVFPVLDHFDVQASVAGNRIVPLAYLGWCFVYATIYSTIAMLFALTMFEDRDLA
ncbi:ABC transporter permease [Anatilimnocola floriformis]|uniref:ABC transporter permease n=1 Tax=Anatilimnocola floriformis TaxID=2948575 RepID=UPI0020C1D779|nr:ABC transporter permease [Anatilimnocola floriformis]